MLRNAFRQLTKNYEATTGEARDDTYRSQKGLRSVINHYSTCAQQTSIPVFRDECEQNNKTGPVYAEVAVRFLLQAILLGQ